MKKRIASLAVGLLGLSTWVQAAPHGIYPTHQQRALNHLLSPFSNHDAAKLVYYGGPVISSVKVYSVFWGSGVTSTNPEQIGGFYSAVVNSTHFDWLKEYNTNVSSVDGRPGTNQVIGRGRYAGSITISPAHTSTKLDDKDIQAELDAQIASHVLPKPDDNSLFMIYFPPGVSIKIDNQASCTTFCAYHEGFVSQTFGNVFYGVLPDQGGACAFGCGGASNPFDDLTSISSHELVEAVTDPFPTPADKPAYPQAWNTTKGEEIGDLCAGNYTALSTPTVTYNLQQEFDNSIAACAAGPYQSP